MKRFKVIKLSRRNETVNYLSKGDISTDICDIILDRAGLEKMFPELNARIFDTLNLDTLDMRNENHWIRIEKEVE